MTDDAVSFEHMDDSAERRGTGWATRPMAPGARGKAGYAGVWQIGNMEDATRWGAWSCLPGC